MGQVATAAASIRDRTSDRVVLPGGGTFEITNLIGSRRGQATAPSPGPQVFLVKTLDEESVTPAHFHAVDQYQVFVQGSGRLGRFDVAPVFLHYVDAFTPYGPITPRTEGLSYLTVRAAFDPVGPQYLTESRPPERHPSRRRYITANFSRPPSRTMALIPSGADGLGAFATQTPKDAPVQHPKHNNMGGVHVIVLEGSLVLDGAELTSLADVFVGPGDAIPQMNAGALGATLLYLGFPAHLDGE